MYADTWTWDGRKWSLAMNDMAPPARMSGAFIFDPVRHVSVLFGGAHGWFSDYLNDTWTFDGSRWLQKSPATMPSPRGFSVLAFDTKRGVVVLFGGFNSNGGLNDSWTWDGTNWTQVVAASNPVPLFPLGLAYNQSSDSLSLVGEVTKGYSIYSEVQTWTFAQQTWSQVTTGGTAPCLNHYGSGAPDVRSGALVFFGGYCTGATVRWDGSKWTADTPSPSPTNRGNEAGRPAMAYDADHHVVLLYGGYKSGTHLNDLWTWDGAAWARLA
jgi:hypothetical protein